MKGVLSPMSVVDSAPQRQYLCIGNDDRVHILGQVAQVVEQRPEKPCVGGSNPPLTTDPPRFSPPSGAGRGFIFVVVCGLASAGFVQLVHRSASQQAVNIKPAGGPSMATGGRFEHRQDLPGLPPEGIVKAYAPQPPWRSVISQCGFRQFEGAD